MGPTDWLGRNDDDQRLSILKQVTTIAVALVMVLSVSAGVGVADVDAPAVQQQETNDTYAVVQGDDCSEITPLSGNESVKSFYDYRTPFTDNPYTNQAGKSFSSEGTVDLQRSNGSRLFLYEDQTGTLSLVFLHGSDDNSSDGGSVSFTIDGLPQDGSWAVKDDEYDNESNYDVWRETGGVHHVDWTWEGGKTDGGAYSGLGDEFEITIDPAFNAGAALYGEHYNGTVRYWSALSNGQGSYDRVPLTAQPVTITSEGC